MNDENADFSWSLLFDMGIEMCLALECLHSWKPPVVHRDLKSLNLLVTQDDRLKLGDFGLARFQTDSSLDTLMKVCGTVAFAAPGERL
jgi:serine/threonine protein kinase